MATMKIEYAFQDIHTGVVYEAGTVQDFTEERIAEINKNLPGFIRPVTAAEAKAVEDDTETESVDGNTETKAVEDDTETKPAKKSRKKKEVTDELPDGEA